VKKIFFLFIIVSCLLSTGFQKVYSEEKSEIFGIRKTDNNSSLEIILFEKPRKDFEKVTKKMIGADIVTPDSIVYIISASKESGDIKLKILKYSFLRLEFSIYFH
jgi:hypothetical protein